MNGHRRQRTAAVVQAFGDYDEHLHDTVARLCEASSEQRSAQIDHWLRVQELEYRAQSMAGHIRALYAIVGALALAVLWLVVR